METNTNAMGKTLHEDEAQSHLNDWQARRQAALIHAGHISQAQEEAARLTERRSVPRFGSLATIKPQGVWRFMYVQANGLAEPSRRRHKLDQMMRIASDFDVDGIALCEVGVNWRCNGRRHRLGDWVNKHSEREVRASSSFNAAGPKISLGQQGGTAIVLLHGLLQYANKTAHDFRKLGRWASWVLSTNPLHRTRLVSAYCPGRSKKTGLKTVYQQHLRLIQSNNLRCSPYELFIEDLCNQLHTWRAAGDRILLFIDANEDILHSRLARALVECKADLREVSHRFWPDGETPHTHASGSLPIDGIFASSDLDVTNLLSLSFHESVGDHRTMIVELSSLSILGQPQGTIVRPTSRRLTTKQASSVKAYNDAVAAQCKAHNIRQRTLSLTETAAQEGYPVTSDTSDAIQTLHRQMDDIKAHAESTCRKILKPASSFSPPVQFWYDKIHAYQALIRMKEAMHPGMNRRHVIRTALRKSIPHPTSMTIDECKEGLRLAKLQQSEVRKYDIEHRKSHLVQCLQIAVDRDDEVRQREIKNRMKSEHNKRVWGSINRVARPRTGRSCLQTQEDVDGVIITHSDQHSVELSIQRECEARFRLGHSAPISHSLLGDDLRYLSDSTIAEQIILGEYICPDYIDQHTSALLTSIGEMGRAVIRGAACTDVVITPRDCQTFWHRINENTSSSPSGQHHGHWMAIAQCPDLAELVTDQMNLIIHSGIPPARWGVALQILLEKVAGNCMVSQLRSIQLYEADYNWFNKIIFHDQAMEALKVSGFLPEEHFSQKESLAEDACFDKILTLDLARQSRQPLSITSVDAAQCYDRVNHIMMGLVWLALGVSRAAISIITECLANMSIFTRTGFGDSKTCFGGKSQEQPFCGLGQGSKAAPASWIQLSSVIIHAYKQRAHGAVFRDPITGLESKSIGCVYVDDTDLYTSGPDLPSVEDIASATQHDVPIWSQSLHSTGGAIKGPKSGWVVVGYECEDGCWSEKESNFDLCIPIGANETVLLKQRGLDESSKSLGVITSPSPGHSAHLDWLRKKTDTWTSSMSNGHLPLSQVTLSYLFQLWPSLRYGLGTLTNDWDSASNCLSSLEFRILPLLGVNRHISQPWRRIHQTFGGIGLLDLAVEQHICRLNMFCQHYGSLSTIGQKLLTSLHWLQLHIGCLGCPLLEAYDTFEHLSPRSWVTSLWESLSRCPGHLQVDYDEITIQRYGDVTLMGLAVRYGLRGEQLTAFNRCRCYGNLLLLSDISRSDGCGIEYTYGTARFTPRISSLSFPPEFPTQSNWEVWTSFWSRCSPLIFSDGFTLGSWLCLPHYRWNWFYDSLLETVYSSQDGGYAVWLRNRGRTRLETGYIFSGKVQTSYTGFPASVHEMVVNGVPRVILPCPGPAFPPEQHTQAPRSLWEILHSWGGHWMWAAIQFDTHGPDTTWLSESLNAGTLIGVADGSYDRVKSPNICGTGWILCDSISHRKIAGSFTELSSSASSYRAEMLGLCAMFVLVRAIETQYDLPSASMSISCDNEVAVKRASANPRRIKPRWACGDILRLFRNIRPRLKSQLRFKYVQSHMDDYVPWDQMSLEEQLNCQCDRLAKAAVQNRLASSELQADNYQLPCERVSIIVDNEKVTRDPSQQLRCAIGRRDAQLFLINQRGWSTHQFEAVDWGHLHSVLHGKSAAFRLWLSKQHSNFCASGVQMVRCKMSTDDRCPSCWKKRERADHLCKCPSAARTDLLESSTDDLARWMAQDEKTDPEITYWVPKYIRGRGSLKFSELGPMSSKMAALAASQDLIGWRNFTEGRISQHFFSIQQAHLATTSVRMNASDWTRKLITKILHLTHAQWLLRNFMLHDHKTGFHMVKRRIDLLLKINILSRTQLHEVPDESKFLLEIDTNDLANGDTENQEYWVCAMEAAINSTPIPGHTCIGPSRPPLRVGGAFTLLEEIRREFVVATGHGPHLPPSTADKAPQPAYPVQSEACSAARSASNRRRKPD